MPPDTDASWTQVILILGNFLNATGHKGGAFGFKVSSINKLVDTKSVKSSGLTLLNFTAKTITDSLPEAEGFLEELEKPAEAHKGEFKILFSEVGCCKATDAPFSTFQLILLEFAQR